MFNKIYKPKSSPRTIRLDETVVLDSTNNLNRLIRENIVSQDRAVKELITAHELFVSGMHKPGKPIKVFLFLGPTGVGKTRLVEAVGEAVWGSIDSVITVDCEEFQQEHEIAKLLGAPPGYIGHKENARNETPINKEKIEKYWTESRPHYTIILFDEIEKGSPALHQLLLKVNGRGKLKLGDNTEVDLQNTVVVMTSNLGSKEIEKILNRSDLGFGANAIESVDDQTIYQLVKKAAKRFFPPEFFNRIDRMVVFHPLSEDSLKKILKIELNAVQDRLIKNDKFVPIEVSERAKAFLIQEGTSKEYGARELNRAVERFVSAKLTRGLITNQIVSGDIVIFDHEPGAKNLTVDIMKAAIDMDAAGAVKPESWVRPEADKPFPSSYKIGRCGRCGQEWNLKHNCSDLEKLEKMRKAITNTPPVVTEPPKRDFCD